jgi:type VI secretion system secreted protein VgrG
LEVGSSATLRTGTTFIGNILAFASITSNTGVMMAGRLLARNGAVTLDDLTLNFPPATTPGGFGGPSATPAPSSWIDPRPHCLACAMLYQTRERWLGRFKNS